MIEFTKCTVRLLFGRYLWHNKRTAGMFQHSGGTATITRATSYHGDDRLDDFAPS